MSPIHHSQAYLIKQIDLPDTDRLGVFYTREYGKQTLLLKGIKKSTSKLQYRLYDWGKSDIEFIVGRSISRLIAIKDIDSYADIHSNMNSVAVMGLLFELLDQLTDDNHQDISVFECIDQYTYLVRNYAEKPYNLIGWLLVRLLYTLGYGMNLSHCVVTGNTKAKDFGISIRSGGLVISQLQSDIDDYIPVNKDLIYVMRQWQKGVWVEIEDFPWIIVQYHLQWYRLHSNSLSLLKV